MQFTHLAEALQGFVGNKLIGVRQVRFDGGDTPRSHLRGPVTRANVHRNFVVLEPFSTDS
jgi:hypothetical protein